ncbi:hypothetical protein EVA_05762 [gut metagenome]|uniref:Uncharacterized protein n=1 Tax=gut metagenome TaxID=749906 RepID=J9D0Q3_9ZZZZ
MSGIGKKTYLFQAELLKETKKGGMGGNTCNDQILVGVPMQATFGCRQLLGNREKMFFFGFCGKAESQGHSQQERAR